MNKDGLNFIAIDFETATPKRASICEVGICVVRNGEVVETCSWLVQPEENLYSYWNMQCHGIRPEDTENSPSFPEVWEEIERLYLDEFDTSWRTTHLSTAAALNTRPNSTACICQRLIGSAR